MAPPVPPAPSSTPASARPSLPAPIRPIGVSPYSPAAVRPSGAEPKPEPEQLELGEVLWQSSTQGHGEVQIAFVEGFIAMRDGRNPDGPALIFTPGEWRAFVIGARDGEFDLT
jgi:hypothetical protein